MTLAIGLLSAASVTLAAQAPQSVPTPQPPDNPQPTITQTQTRATPANPAITITGCLQQERDVAGLRPSAVERPGVTDNYVISGVKISPSSSVSGIGISTKYEVEGIPEADLQKHLNHQVELMGQIVQADNPASDLSPNFRATSMKMIAATCGAAQ